MSRYIQFTAKDGSIILVEVETEEVSPPQGVVKAGLKEKVQDAIAVAKAPLGKALERAVRYNAQALIQSVQSLPEPPTEAEITFGLKATGEVGNVAIARASGEANYTIKLTWKFQSKETK